MDPQGHSPSSVFPVVVQALVIRLGALCLGDSVRLQQGISEGLWKRSRIKHALKHTPVWPRGGNENAGSETSSQSRLRPEYSARVRCRRVLTGGCGVSPLIGLSCVWLVRKVNNWGCQQRPLLRYEFCMSASNRGHTRVPREDGEQLTFPRSAVGSEVKTKG